MGRYRKKPYKKQQKDIYNQKALEDEIEDELDLFFNQDPEESVLFLDEEPRLFNDEPEIIRQLREEELHGKLPLWLSDFNEEETNDVISQGRDQAEKKQHDEFKTRLKIDLLINKMNE